MKKLILLFCLTFSLICVRAENIDSLIDTKIDGYSQIQHRIDSLQNVEIYNIKEFENSYKIKESLFSNQLAVLTAIFSAIVAISIFIIGYLIPKTNNEKHENQINKLLKEFESIRDEINQSRNETKKLEAKNNMQNAKVMFLSCIGTSNVNGLVLWGLRYVKFTYEMYEDPHNMDMLVVINEVKKNISKLEDKKVELKEFIDELNELIAYLKGTFELDGIEDSLELIKSEYNRICWTPKS